MLFPNKYLTLSLFLLFMLCLQSISAQQLTQKYNDLLDRVEFYNANGMMIG